jgi:hypothetical protein
MSHDERLEKGGVYADSDDELKRTETAVADDAAINQFTPAEQKKIVRRIDFRLVTTLGLLYCASLMDRTNLGSAAIAG